MKLTLIFILLLSNSIFAQEILDWKFYHPVKKEFVEAGTHGSVQEKLIATGELPDPFYGQNEPLFGWIEEYKWEFYSTITITAEMLDKEFVELEFPGIDTYAEIFLNEVEIGFAQNAFRPYRFEVKKVLKLGENKIKVVFYPPVLFHKEAYTNAKYKLPAPNDVNPIAIAPYTRKPQYQFGWDWSLRMNTIGFLKPVSVHAYNTATVFGTNIIVDDLQPEIATLALEIQFTQTTTDSIIWVSKLFGEQRFDKGAIKIWREEMVENPVLWWPRGQGNQYLYEDEWIVYNSKKEIIYSKKIKFGIKKSELVMEADQWGTGYVIKVNGRPIFCKGGDYIPQDIFPARVKDADLIKMVQTMASCNFNMVRVWGGGYYPDEAFFNACDEMGIMVWQDFMFACAMYPGDPDFLINVKEELEYQIPRIASHASLTIFNGNNEVDVAWKNWGFQAKYNLYGKDAEQIEEYYNRLFKQLIPQTVKSLSVAPYIHTSPLSNWGKAEYYNHGTQHYWGVWHGKDPMEDFAKKIGRFNAEYGFQSFPEYSTLLSFSAKTDWSLDSDIMKHHQKSYVGNGMILKHATNLYGKPASFEDFVYYSQLTQATAVSMAVSGHRLDAPRCMGTLYWQVNDCWPAPSWSSIDYFGNWKALQYAVRNDYEDVAVLSRKNEKGIPEYYLHSDKIDTFRCELHATLYDLKGKVLHEFDVTQMINGNESLKICLGDFRTKHPKTNFVIRFLWKDANGKLHTRYFSELPVKYKKAEKNSVKMEISDIDMTLKTAVIHLDTRKYLRNCWVYSLGQGVTFEDNFQDLLPGKHQIKIQFESVPSLREFEMKWL